MNLLISQLHEGENHFKYESTRDAWMGELVSRVQKQGYKLLSPLAVDLSLTKLEPDYYMKGKLEFQVEQVCARCAEAFSFAVKNPFELALAHVNSTRVKPELSEESEELDITFFNGNELELAPILEEQFFLSIPYQSICDEDCRGICQKCGKNLNEETCSCKRGDVLSPFSVLENRI